jgi:hypothetical protein
VRGGLLVVILLLGAGATPQPWRLLWFLVPALVAGSLLLAWRFGRAALLAPFVLLAGVAILQVATRGTPVPLWFTAWLPLASSVGAWMGLREEGGGPTLGEKAWMVIPLLLFAAALPLAPGFPAAAARLGERTAAQLEHAAATGQSADLSRSWQEMKREVAGSTAAERSQWELVAIPNLMFAWMVMLAGIGRSLAGRGATLLGWPPLSRSRFETWRLPDAALAPLIAGIALLAFANGVWHPSGLTLLLHVVLGYSVQGMAVVESLLRARGMSPVLVALAMVFVVVVSLAFALPLVAVVGLSDVWRDYRRLEPSPTGEA